MSVLYFEPDIGGAGSELEADTTVINGRLVYCGQTTTCPIPNPTVVSGLVGRILLFSNPTTF